MFSNDPLLPREYRTLAGNSGNTVWHGAGYNGYTRAVLVEAVTGRI